MNNDIKKHIQEALKKGVRLDGRKLDEFRPIEVELGVVANAEGSAKVKCGDTEVIVGVKLGVGKPFPDRPGDGALMVNAELIPMSNPEFESGPPGIDAIEASRVIDRGIRESGAIDEKKLCITVGESVWIANIDVYPLNFDGNLIDVGGFAAVAALRTATFPGLKDGMADYKNMTKNKLPLKFTPIPVTVFKIGDQFIVDPTQDEEKAAVTRLTITTIDDGKVCSLQKSGNGSLMIEDVSQMIDIAIKKGKELRKLLG